MLALLLAAGAAVAARNLLPLELTITDQSPLLEFSADSNWNSSFSGSDWRSYTPGAAGIGSSWHWIDTGNLNGSDARPRFGLDMAVSDIIVMGDVNGSPPSDKAISATITQEREGSAAGTGPSGGETVDVPASEGIKLSPGQLARVSGLNESKSSWVEFTITDAVPAKYNVRSLVVTTGLSSDADNLDKVPRSTVSFVVDGKPNTAFVVDGVWNVTNTTLYDGNTPRNVSELVCPQGEQNSTVTIPVPSYTSFFVVNGTVGPDRSSATFALVPAPPSSNSSHRQPGNATRPWVSGQTLFVEQLDPDVNYSLSVLQSTTGAVHLDAVTFFSANGWVGNTTATDTRTKTKPEDGDSGPPVSAIVGGVVGGVGGALILTLLAFYLWIWRPRKRREREEAAAVGRSNAGFVPFGSNATGGGADDERPPQHIVQETDAGTLVLPPQYNPAWSAAGTRGTGTGAGTATMTSASHFTHSEKSHLSITPSGSAPSSAVSALTPLAPWKEPYINGTYAETNTTNTGTNPETHGTYAGHGYGHVAAPLSAITPTSDSGAPFAHLPPGAAPTQSVQPTQPARRARPPLPPLPTGDGARMSEKPGRL